LFLEVLAVLCIDSTVPDAGRMQSGGESMTMHRRPRLWCHSFELQGFMRDQITGLPCLEFGVYRFPKTTLPR
jgi:hypothetical protein